MRKNSIAGIAALIIFAISFPAVLVAQSAPTATAFRPMPFASGPIKVGPAKGTLVVVGGGVIGPRVWKAFIDAAGGPDALILDVPNASVASADDKAPQEAGQRLRDNGARNVVVLFTKDRKIADSEAFTAIIKKAGGIWFDGGRQFRLVRDYGQTKTEQAFMDLLDRGGVIGGTSAGASIQGDFMVRGAPSDDNSVMDYPGSNRGFGYLRNVGIDQHVVARSRLPDLADSIIPKYPGLLGISEDEGTAWVIHGDAASIVGRNKAFVYNGNDPTDPGAPFLTLYPGDRYDLNTRLVVSRAADRSPVKPSLITSLFEKYNTPATGGATVLVAQDGNVFVDRAFGIPAQPRYMPRTTVPQFPLGNITKAFKTLCAQLPPLTTKPNQDDAKRAVLSQLQSCVAQLSKPVGMHQTGAESGEVRSNVDELYRFSLALEVPATWPKIDYADGWTRDTYRGVKRHALYATTDGKRAAFVRIPSRHATVIILTNDSAADARGMSERILEQLFGAS
ncbi:MAG: cyanophycinase [Rhodanobacter sp.]